MPWSEIWSVRLASKGPAGAEYPLWHLVIRGIASGQWSDFSVPLETNGVGNLAIDILAKAPASAIAREPMAASALAELAEKTRLAV